MSSPVPSRSGRDGAGKPATTLAGTLPTAVVRQGDDDVMSDCSPVGYVIS